MTTSYVYLNLILGNASLRQANFTNGKRIHHGKVAGVTPAQGSVKPTAGFTLD